MTQTLCNDDKMMSVCNLLWFGHKVHGAVDWESLKEKTDEDTFARLALQLTMHCCFLSS